MWFGWLMLVCNLKNQNKLLKLMLILPCDVFLEQDCFLPKLLLLDFWKRYRFLVMLLCCWIKAWLLIINYESRFAVLIPDPSTVSYAVRYEIARWTKCQYSMRLCTHSVWLGMVRYIQYGIEPTGTANLGCETTNHFSLTKIHNYITIIHFDIIFSILECKSYMRCT